MALNSELRAVRWAILGTGAIAADFAAALQRSSTGELRAVGSGSESRAADFGAGRSELATGTYADVLARDDVDAVYVATLHPSHAELSIAALRAGKAVLCEKPAALSVADARGVLDEARIARLPFVEAYKYRFGPLAARVRELIADGAVGEIERVVLRASFSAPHREGRLFDPAAGGGAILDMGGYPVSLAVGIARWSGKGSTAQLDDVHGEIGPTGVEESASAIIHWGSFEAHVFASITDSSPAVAIVHGTRATLELSPLWGSRTTSGSHILLQRHGAELERIEAVTVDPLAAEADALGMALLEQRTELAEISWAETREIASLLHTWRDALAP